MTRSVPEPSSSVQVKLPDGTNWRLAFDKRSEADGLRIITHRSCWEGIAPTRRAAPPRTACSNRLAPRALVVPPR